MVPVGPFVVIFVGFFFPTLVRLFRIGIFRLAALPEQSHDTMRTRSTMRLLPNTRGTDREPARTGRRIAPGFFLFPPGGLVGRCTLGSLRLPQIPLDRGELDEKLLYRFIPLGEPLAQGRLPLHGLRGAPHPGRADREGLRRGHGRRLRRGWSGPGTRRRGPGAPATLPRFFVTGELGLRLGGA